MHLRSDRNTQFVRIPSQKLNVPKSVPAATDQDPQTAVRLGIQHTRPNRSRTRLVARPARDGLNATLSPVRTRFLSQRRTAFMPIPIKRTIESVPGGMMTIPLAAGAVVSTFAPHAASFFGSFTGALFTGA